MTWFAVTGVVPSLSSPAEGSDVIFTPHRLSADSRPEKGKSPVTKLWGSPSVVVTVLSEDVGPLSAVPLMAKRSAWLGPVTGVVVLP